MFLLLINCLLFHLLHGEKEGQKEASMNPKAIVFVLAVLFFIAAGLRVPIGPFGPEPPATRWVPGWEWFSAACIVAGVWLL